MCLGMPPQLEHFPTARRQNDTIVKFNGWLKYFWFIISKLFLFNFEIFGRDPIPRIGLVSVVAVLLCPKQGIFILTFLIVLYVRFGCFSRSIWEFLIWFSTLAVSRRLQVQAWFLAEFQRYLLFTRKRVYRNNSICWNWRETQFRYADFSNLFASKFNLGSWQI